MTEIIEQKKTVKDIKEKKNTVEEIQRKLEKLEKLKAMLKDPRISVEDIDEEELDALLSRMEIMEEALKNYMYQFGMSLYQNKNGDNYFKKFAYGTEIRNYGELDSHNFFVNEREPGFFEKLFEYTPPERVDLKGNIQNVVYDLYERDASMVDAFDEVIAEETDRCKDILERAQETAVEREGHDKSLEKDVEYIQQNEKVIQDKEHDYDTKIGDANHDKPSESIEKDEDVRVIGIDEMEIDLLPDDEFDEDIDVDYDNYEWKEGYESGSERKEDKVQLPKVDKVRRVKKDKRAIIPSKDNTQNR